jgi:hypothetical protein
VLKIWKKCKILNHPEIPGFSKKSLKVLATQKPLKKSPQNSRKKLQI